MPPSISPSPTVLLPHLPPKTFVGIDLVTFTSTANFHGIRDLPNGWHFLYTGTTESLSLRSGGWFYVGDISTIDESLDGAVISASHESQGLEVFIWRWDSETESLVPLRGNSDIDKQEAMRHRANLGSVWQRGGLFRYRSRVSSSQALQLSNDKHTPIQDETDEESEEEGRRDWEALTDKLSLRLLSRIVGDPELDVDNRPRWMVTSASTAGRDNDDIAGLPEQGSKDMVNITGEVESEFSFLPIDFKKTWREGAIGRERTEAAQDRSWALGNLIRQYSDYEVTKDERFGEAQVLGELQFTFLMVLTLMNYSCLQQWKRLLELILTSCSAIKGREPFMKDVLILLLLQLKRCDDVEGGLFDIDGVEGGEFLRKLLMKFRISLYEVIDSPGPAVKSEFEKLATWVKDEYDWELNRQAFVRRGMIQLEDGEQVEMEMKDDDEDDETGEYAPVVVDLGEDDTTQEINMDDMQMQ